MEPETDTAESEDRESFVRLLMRHDRTIRAFLRSLLPSNNDVDEVMQEVSVVAWRKFGELDQPENFCRWVCGISRLEVLMYRRTQARDRLVLNNEIDQLIANEGVDELALRQRQLDALEGCVEKLPSEKQQLLLRVYSAGESMKVIAEQIGKTPQALYKLLSRLRQELLGCVERSTSEIRR